MLPVRLIERDRDRERETEKATEREIEREKENKCGEKSLKKAPRASIVAFYKRISSFPVRKVLNFHCIPATADRK